MLVLGVDPGTRHLGWGLVEQDGNRVRHVAHGVISPRGTDELAARLVHIGRELREVVLTYKPTHGSVETLFFHKDAQAAAKLGHARGVVLLVLAQADVQLAEYQPAKVKLTVAGNGRAEKVQVAQMIRSLLGLEEPPAADAADALALAVTHLRRAPLDEALRRSSRPGLVAVPAARARRGRTRLPRHLAELLKT